MSDTIKTTTTEITTNTNTTTGTNPSSNSGLSTPQVPTGNIPPVPSNVVQLDHDRLKRGLFYYLTLGIRGLLGSKKGTLVLLMIAIGTAALFIGKLDGTSYVALITIASGIYTAVSGAVDIRGGAPSS